MSKFEEARKNLVLNWDSSGECKSCGWHAALSEYSIFDEDIEYAIENNGGILELPCLSKDDEEGRHRHRGVFVSVVELNGVE